MLISTYKHVHHKSIWISTRSLFAILLKCPSFTSTHLLIFSTLLGKLLNLARGPAGWTFHRRSHCPIHRHRKLSTPRSFIFMLQQVRFHRDFPLNRCTLPLDRHSIHKYVIYNLKYMALEGYKEGLHCCNIIRLCWPSSTIEGFSPFFCI